MSKKGGLVEVKKNLDNISYEEFVDIVEVPSKVLNLLSGNRFEKCEANNNTTHWCDKCNVMYAYTEDDRELLLTALKQAEKRHFVLTLTPHGKQILHCNKTEVKILVDVGWCQHNKDKFYKQYFNKDVTVNYDRNKFICLHCLIRVGTLVQSRGSCGTTGIKAFETLQPICVNGELNKMFISHNNLEVHANKWKGGWQFNTWYNNSDRWVARGDHLTIVTKAPVVVVDKEVRSKQLEDKKKMAADIRKKARAEESRKQKLSKHAAIKLQAFVRGRLTRNNIMLMKTTATKIQALVRGHLTRKTLKRPSQVLIWNNGEYIGEVQNDLPNGRGKFSFTKGGEYIGDFKDGKPHGYGTYTSIKSANDFLIYRGEYYEGMQHGKGVAEKPNGIYVGGWKNNNRHGHGTLKLYNGHYIVGDWGGDDTVNGTVEYPDGTKKIGKWTFKPTKRETRNAKKKEKARRKKAVIKIQALVRGHLARMEVTVMRSVKVKAVRKLQAVVRGYLIRKKNKIHVTFSLPRLGCTINDDDEEDKEVDFFTSKNSAFGIVGSSIDWQKGLGLQTVTPIQPVVPSKKEELYLFDVLVYVLGGDNVELAKQLIRDVSIDLFDYKGIYFNDYMSRHVLDVVKQVIVEHNGDLAASYIAFEKNCHAHEIPKFRRQLFFNCVASYVKQEKAVEVQYMNQMLK